MNSIYIFSYEVISKNVNSLDRSVNLIFKAYLSCNSLVTDKETVLIFFCLKDVDL